METITGNTFYFDFEVRLMEFLQAVFGEKGALFISQFSVLGETLVFVLIMGILYWGIDKKSGIKFGTALTFMLCLCPLLKNIAFRRRPYFDNPGVKIFRPVEKGADIYDIGAQGFSFPSAHSANSVTVYGTLARCKDHKIFKILAVVFPLLVGFSRIVVGAHYPTDVLCGWILGILVVITVPSILDKAGEKNRWKVYVVLFIISAIGVFYCKTDDYYTGFGIMCGYLLGVELEEKFIRFEDGKKPFEIVFRVFFGIVLFGGISTLLKYPFPKELLSRGDFVSYIIRVFRYFSAAFISIGVYPACFKRVSKLFDR